MPPEPRTLADVLAALQALDADARRALADLADLATPTTQATREALATLDRLAARARGLRELAQRASAGEASPQARGQLREVGSVAEELGRVLSDSRAGVADDLRGAGWGVLDTRGRKTWAVLARKLPGMSGAQLAEVNGMTSTTRPAGVVLRPPPDIARGLALALAQGRAA